MASTPPDSSQVPDSRTAPPLLMAIFYTKVAMIIAAFAVRLTTNFASEALLLFIWLCIAVAAGALGLSWFLRMRGASGT